MRLSLAETGQITLTPTEASTVQRVLSDYIAEKSERLRTIASEPEENRLAPA
jgi:hypothetical protein